MQCYVARHESCAILQLLEMNKTSLPAHECTSFCRYYAPDLSRLGQYNTMVSCPSSTSAANELANVDPEVTSNCTCTV